MNWIEVADTAIKIGLGALIAGLFPLISSIVSNRHQAVMSREERLRKVFEEVSRELEAALSMLFSKAMDDARYTDEALSFGYDEEEWFEKVRAFEDVIDDTIATVNILDGRLRLYECNTAANKLSKITELLYKLPEKLGPMNNSSQLLETTVREFFKEASDTKAEFYAELNREAKKALR